MGERLKNSLWMFICTFGCGLMLSIFPLVQSPFNLVFSLLAFLIGIFFFKRFSTIGSRILFFVLSLIFFMLFTIVIAMIIYIRQNPLPAA
ncbi:hypothetical protein [Paenibacillus sp. GCM10027626]|uniref:hypothetical protein n=1 Tax=Paenibacillus sp. GCM10027626 TaxID=3273411 RepID=UPI0036332709